MILRARRDPARSSSASGRHMESGRAAGRQGRRRVGQRDSDFSGPGASPGGGPGPAAFSGLGPGPSGRSAPGGPLIFRARAPRREPRAAVSQSLDRISWQRPPFYDSDSDSDTDSDRISWLRPPVRPTRPRPPVCPAALANQYGELESFGPGDFDRLLSLL